MKRLRFCFKTSDYETLDYDKYIAIQLDYKRIFYGITFKTKSKKIINDEMINVDTGFPEICDYQNCTLHKLWFYFKLPTMNKAIWFKYHTVKYKQKVKD